MKVRVPKINDRVEIELPDGLILVSRVEDVDGQEVFLAQPSLDGVTYMVRTGVDAVLVWTSERGVISAAAQVAERVDGAVPQIRVVLSGSSVEQRRDQLRQSCLVNLELRVAGDVATTGWTLDLSAGGARVEAPAAALLDIGDTVWLTLQLPEWSMELRSLVVRKEAEKVVALRFLDLRAADEERLVQYVFGAHRRAVQRGVG